MWMVRWCPLSWSVVADGEAKEPVGRLVVGPQQLTWEISDRLRVVVRFVVEGDLRFHRRRGDLDLVGPLARLDAQRRGFPEVRVAEVVLA